MAKIKEYYQVGNREEMTTESLLVLLEDMYKDLALAVNSNTSSGDGNIIAFATVNGFGTLLNGNGLTTVRLSAGVYKLTFDTEMSDTNYTVVVSPQMHDIISVLSTTVGVKTTTNFIIKVKSLANVAYSPNAINVIVVN